MVAILNAEFKRFWWIWLLFTFVISIALIQGVYSFKPAVVQSKKEIRAHELRGDIDVTKSLEIKQTWKYPYYFARVILPNIILFLSMQTLFIAASSIARESEKKTLALLLSFPTNRRKLLVQKYLFGLIALTASLVFIYALFAVLSISIGELIDIKFVLALGLLQLVQFTSLHSLAFLFSASMNNQWLVFSLSAIMGFVLFLNPITPKTGYLDVGSILLNGTIPGLTLLGMLLLIFAAFESSIIIFAHRELSS